jgi:hypothetical protein
MPEPTARQAVVVGGSIGGLTTALLLRDLGWDVDIPAEVAQQQRSGESADRSSDDDCLAGPGLAQCVDLLSCDRHRRTCDACGSSLEEWREQYYVRGHMARGSGCE